MLTKDVIEQAKTLRMNACLDFYYEVETRGGPLDLRTLAKHDRFYLLTCILNRKDAVHPWLYARVREVESNTDGHLDLWSRFHYKSTIITFAGIIQEVLLNPEITIGIFSHTKGIARAFLAQIKGELERNERLKALFPDILYSNPSKESPRWSLDFGITVKRESNPKESTVEAWGLVDGQPTSKHYALRVYDDVVTRESVTTPEQIEKTTIGWELSLSLSAHDSNRFWMCGTRYHYADTYHVVMERGAVKPRVYPATDNGAIDGNPVFLSHKQWQEILRNTGSYTVACQNLQNPLAGTVQTFSQEWIQYYQVRPQTLNVYIMVDPASSKKKGSDRSAFMVVGVDAQMNKYLLDGAMHRMSLSERWVMLKNLYMKWLRQSGVQLVKVGYERYGMQSDLEYFREQMKVNGNPYFEINELNWTREGGNAKNDRIMRLEPDLRNLRFFFPQETSQPSKLQQKFPKNLHAKAIKQQNEEKKLYNVVDLLHSELLQFPYASHDDGPDALSRLYDMDIRPAMIANSNIPYEQNAYGAY